MTWTKREAVTNLVILGDADGCRRKIGGLLIGMPHDKGYPDKVNYEIVQKDGEVSVLSGSATLARQITAADIGKFLKCEFTGWGKSGNGKFKIIDVNVWEGEATDDMKTWPRYAETRTLGRAAAPATASRTEPDDFGGALADEDDDLPF